MKISPEVIKYCQQLRHCIHKSPELTWEEKNTSVLVAQELKKIPNIEVQYPIAKYGVVGLLKGAKPGPTIGFRADMDALPILEKNSFSYRSQVDGVMHACGHDGHTAILLGVAKILSEHNKKLAGQIKFLFQPAEEGGAGAKVMTEEGALDNPYVEKIYALHGWPELSLGKIAVRAGTIMAATAEIQITVDGKGGHAAFPHTAIDTILIGSKIVEALQSVSSRLTEPTEPIVLSITQFHGGTTHNVIPQSVVLKGTLRTCNQKTQKKSSEQIKQLCLNIAAAYGATVDVQVTPGYPAAINEENAAKTVYQIAKDCLGSENAIWSQSPSMGGEDFAYFLEERPGAYFHLGLNDRPEGYPSLHDPKFDFNDKALKLGISMFLKIAEHHLK